MPTAKFGSKGYPYLSKTTFKLTVDNIIGRVELKALLAFLDEISQPIRHWACFSGSTLLVWSGSEPPLFANMDIAVHDLPQYTLGEKPAPVLRCVGCRTHAVDVNAFLVTSIALACYSFVRLSSLGIDS